jgi:nucleotide-binding universal stress UspA family protein
MKTLNIKKILIPTDFSKTGLLAVEHAAFMARACKADLYLFHAIELSESAFSIYNPGIVISGLTEIDTIANNLLSDLAASLRKKYGITTKTICVKNRAAQGVVDAVNEYKIDIVLMGTHGVSGFNEYFIGSNAQRVVAHCPCPVITAQAHAKKLGFTNIVLPVDDSFNSRQKVNTTISLARKYSATIHVLGLLNKSRVSNPKAFKLKLDSIEKAIQKAGLPYEVKTVKGDNLAITAMKYSKKVKADLIVVLTEHESQLPGVSLGPFARQIVNHSKIPVMSIRPEELRIMDPLSLAGSNPF